nr:hypothetical protein [uncultured Anaerotignum sp.]
MSRKRTMTKSDWNKRKNEFGVWKVLKNTEKKEFGDGFIVNFYDTNGRLFWRYERYWNSIGRFAKGDYRYSKRFTYDETNGLICVKRKHSERSMTSFYDGEQLEMEPLSETEAMDLPSELHRFWERDKASVGKITWDKGESLFGYSVFDKENGEKIRYYLQNGSYFCMICRENPQKPWVLRGPAEGKYAWMVYGIERRKENEEDLSARVTVYTDILSTEMFLEILDYFRSMCSGDIVLYLNGWLAMPTEISRRNEQEAKKRNINFFFRILNHWKSRKQLLPAFLLPVK